ncbi:hypothetical protein GOODEAATRI_018302 [Goodea atripinnis]|uniref:ERO1-like protein alpha n=1 Tax=Goodea atripinnis TaxID=208336 RepID=A0ABV0PF23_9TELE
MSGSAHGKCFCQVTGELDDCACDVETIDGFNNEQLFPKLQTLLESDYFRFYKVIQPDLQRFDSDLTVGEGPKRLRNLYFLYLIELRALAKVLPFFKQPSFRLYTGRTEEDQKHKELLLDILQLARSVYKPKEN